MPELLRYSYEFGPFRLDTAMRQLQRGEHAVAMDPQLLDLLVHLVEHHRQWVGRRTLAGLTIPRLAPAQLAQRLHTLCALLPADPLQGDWIQTHPRRGWRFVADVLLATQIDAASDLGHTALIDTAGGERPGPAAAAQGAGTIRPGMQLARFEILALLGSGGMGEVFLARDRHLDRKIALKLLPLRYTRIAEWLQRFKREARTISALNHPNILTIHEIGDVDGRHFIATEHIEGQTLRIRLLAGRLPLAEALQIAGQVASALEAAHAAGIIHRDIKPENIMIRPDGYVKLLDFGLAKPLYDLGAQDSPLQTMPGVVMGTVNYMSPEQARGLPVDARSDVFSLGVVLYEMLAGTAPFTGATPSDVMAAVLERQPLPLSAHMQNPPPELERLVETALHKDLGQRFSSIKVLQSELKTVQQDVELRTRFGDSWHGMPRQLQSASTSSLRLAAAPASAPPAPLALPSEAIWQIPEVRYARSGELNIAYQVIGDAPLDLVFVMGWISHLEYFWTEPSFARFLRRLAGFARVILFDKRGTGLSDRVPLEQLPTLEQRMDDVRAVMEAVGSERAVLCGVSEGGPMCSLFAATYPERTIALVMLGSYARRLRGEGYPWGPSVADRDHFLDEIRTHWGGPVGLEERAPSVAQDPAFRAWWAAYLRRGASPGAAVALTKMNTEIDIRRVLPTVRVPTLVVHRRGDLCLKVDEGRYLAEHIAGAKFVELEGIDHLPFVGAQDEILDEIEEFLTGVRHASGFDRVLATVLVARIVDPHKLAPDLGHRHQEFFRKEVELFKGKCADIQPFQALATFDGPARAIRAACAIRAFAQRLGIQLQLGLHTGECDVLGVHVGGIATDIARQVAAECQNGEVLVSSTVKDLVAGSGIVFAEPTQRSWPAALGDWRLYAVLRS